MPLGRPSWPVGEQVAAQDPRFSDPNALLKPVAAPDHATNPMPAGPPRVPAGPTNSPGAALIPSGSSDLTTNAAGPNYTNFFTMETLDDKHKLALGDRLSFRIVEDQEDPRDSLDPKPYFVPFQVMDSGDVEVPYIGRFPASGKTCRRLAAEIKVALEKKYYYQATVIIALDQITKSTTGRVYISGQVRVPGAVEIPADEVFTVSKAILRAGGFGEYAKKTDVKVTRRTESGAPTVITVNVGEILEKGKTEHDLKLESGDTIFVPNKFISI